MSNKIPFRTAYDHQHDRNLPFPDYTAPSGSRYKNEYEYEIDSYGRKVLKKTGVTDQYAQIQEELEETKIENILRKAAIGDYSNFRPDGIYADISTMPNNMIEARQAMQQLENTWRKLSSEIKAKYNNNIEEFIAQAGTEAWQRDMGLLKEVEKTIEEIAEVAEEVTQDE